VFGDIFKNEGVKFARQVIFIQFCDFITKLKPCFTDQSQDIFVLDIFSALCNGDRPVGLSGIDASHRKALFNKGGKYRGLTKPIKAHIRENNNSETFIAYCESSVATSKFGELCTAFDAPHNTSRTMLFKAIFANFVEFAKSSDDFTSNTFIMDFLNNPPIEYSTDEDNSLSPISAGDNFTLVRQTLTYPYTQEIYKTFTHHWIIKNTGSAIWDNRHMDFVNRGQIPLKLTNNSKLNIEKVLPNNETTITIEVETRHMEGEYEIILDMENSEGRLCFPDKRAELRLPVTVFFKPKEINNAKS
jgi:hypothetical protein